MNGIDVSARDGVIDWAGAYAEGVDFALLCASVGIVADPLFAKNVREAAAAGLAVGAYHRFCAQSAEDAVVEAQFFLRHLRSVREKIRLWAICCVEEAACAPLAAVFLHAVAADGYSPMLAAEPYVLPLCGTAYPLWLLLWGVPEARALSYAPKIWQYGEGSLAAAPRVGMNRGYFRIE